MVSLFYQLHHDDSQEQLTDAIPHTDKHHCERSPEQHDGEAPPAHEEDGAVGGAGAQLPHQLPARLAAAAEHQRDQTGCFAEPGTCPSNIRTPMWSENVEAQKQSVVA